MLLCYICGRDASTGWIKGFVPAPDSQKLALCNLHDNQTNRFLVVEAWQKRLKKEIETQTSIAENKLDQTLFTATVRFIAGGMVSFPCTQCEPTPQNTLRIVSPEGEQTFIPMQHIRDFSVRPHNLDIPEVGTSNNAQKPDALKALPAEEPDNEQDISAEQDTRLDADKSVLESKQSLEKAAPETGTPLVENPIALAMPAIWNKG